jgi:hypothetical protein
MELKLPQQNEDILLDDWITPHAQLNAVKNILSSNGLSACCIGTSYVGIFPALESGAG